MKTRQQNIQLWLVIGLLVISITYSVVAAIAVFKGGALSDRTGILWILCFAMLVALWAKNDARARGEQKPFEYSYFVFLLWPVVLPYHLIKNRGTDGLVMFLGFLAIHELPSFVAVMAYAYSSR
jgi:FtsH-binding integral membrane protein